MRLSFSDLAAGFKLFVIVELVFAIGAMLSGSAGFVRFVFSLKGFLLVLPICILTAVFARQRSRKAD